MDGHLIVWEILKKVFAMCL